MTDLSHIRLFATHPHTCSYLDDQEATTIFVDPTADVDIHLYSRLSEIGFRRSGSHLYRPHCAQCQACIPARIPVAQFKPNRQQRRCWARNRDIEVRKIDSIDTTEHYDLYERYINERHNDGDMYPPSKIQYDAFLTSEWGATRYFEFRCQETLLGVAVSDEMDNALSAVYTFFDPDENRRSLGSFGILYQIYKARELNLKHLYLGYWIKKCSKMSYKTQYRPLEVMVDRQWKIMSP